MNKKPKKEADQVPALKTKILLELTPIAATKLDAYMTKNSEKIKTKSINFMIENFEKLQIELQQKIKDINLINEEIAIHENAAYHFNQFYKRIIKKQHD